MGIYYRANLIRLEATGRGTWLAYVTPFQPAGPPWASRSGKDEGVGEFAHREEAIAAAQAHIDGKASAPHGDADSLPQGAGGAAHEILIIDDDKLTRFSLMQVLVRAGYRVRAAASAAEGLANAREAPPDLVLLDVQLPDGDGGSVLQAFRRSAPTLPVVMMSADPAPETVQRLRRLGACDFLAKPCASILLLALVASLL